MSHLYTLQEPDFCTPVPCNKGAMQWAAWMTGHCMSRRVARDTTPGSVRVVTTFMGLDPDDDGSGNKPRLWQTKVYGGRRNGEVWRYSSRESAKEGHSMILEVVTSEERDFV